MHKYILFVIFSLSSVSLLSQELDESFLESLPKDIQDDVIERAGERPDDEVPVYRSLTSSSEIEKRALEDLKERLELDLFFLEEKLAEDQDRPIDGEGLKLFGEDFFGTYQSTFMPINEPNLDPAYILDFGDIIEIQIIGQIESIDTYLIGRDGSINIPDVGKFNLSGISMSDASSLIKAKVSNAYIGTEAFVSLNSIRDINVLVSGNAFNPGVYTLSGNSNLLHAVAVAGGINEFGSYRNISLIRDNQLIETLDMYDVLLSGFFDSKVRLRSGDVIFINPVSNIVSIEGAVKRPAMYELLADQNLSDVISYANGISKEADLKNISLERILDGKIESLRIVNVSQFSDIESKDGDKLFIREHSFRKVSIQGAVLKPGNYIMSEGETVDDLINKSGGYTPNAYPFGAVYENQNALIINKMAKDVLYKEFLDNIILISQQNPDGIDIPSLLGLTREIKNTKANGRVVIDLMGGSDSSNMVIRNNDRLTIPEKTNHIYVYGEVSSEGAILFENARDVKYFIEKSGGLKEGANKKAIYVLHPNGNTTKYLVKRNLFASSSREVNLYPGSVIFVPREVDDSVGSRLAAQAYVSILGNLGVALASLSAIND
tara:strand:+ start:81 stop:1895 length:1815 start_codon:yes stop_codon:yes gene_type:complete